MNNDTNQESEKSRILFSKPRKILLAAGLLLIGAGVLLFGLKESLDVFSFIAFRAFFFFLVGGILFYRSMTGKKLSSLFFISLVILCNGFLIIAVDIGLIPYKLIQIWPVMVMLSGIMLVPTGIYKTGRVTSRFLVPAVMIFFMGVFFLLFSLDIIPVSFISFSAQWWPLFFILAGLFLVALFFYGKKKDSM